MTARSIEGEPTARTKAEQAYLQIEAMIVGEQLPPSSIISESRLMELTGFGRTPVREALQRLARARMVEVLPHRGVLIPAISVEEQLRMLELRRVLEPLAASLAARRADASDRARLSALLEELRGEVQDATAYAETLRQVHETVGRAAHNAYLVDAITAVQGLSRRFWFAHLRDASSEIARGSALYGQGIAAVLDGDREGAERALLALNDYLVEFTRATLDEQGSGLG